MAILAENIVWDLSGLYTSPDDPLLREHLQAIQDFDFEDGNSDFMGQASLSLESLSKRLEDLEYISRLGTRLLAYVQLRSAIHVDDEDVAALRQKVEETLVPLRKAENELALGLASLGEEQADRLLSAPELSQTAHGLRRLRERKTHLLGRDEEALCAEMELPASLAWKKLYDKLLGGIAVGPRGMPLGEATALLHSPDREVRRTTADAIAAALEPATPVLAHALNTLLHGKSLQDTKRKRPSWLHQRLESNETSVEAVQAMLAAVDGHTGLQQRYYRLKARLLGLDKLMDYDRFAPVGGLPPFTWEQAVQEVLAGVAPLGERASTLAGQCFTQGWVDAAPRPGKLPGAFCHSASPDGHPYILLNFTGTARDVLVLAHELGHGLHACHSNIQPMLHREPSLVMAEVPSTLSELLTFRELFSRAETAEARLSLVCRKLEDSFLTIFRQAALHKVESALHTWRREVGELSMADLERIWREPQEAQVGSCMEFGPHYGVFWALVMHFFHFPGYVHCYAMAELLAHGLEANLEKDPADFPHRFAGFLSAGSGAAPKDLLTPFGLNPEDPATYRAGLRRLEILLEEAEYLAREVTHG